MTDTTQTPNQPLAEPLCSAVGCREPRAHVARDEDGDPQSLCDAHHERVRAEGGQPGSASRGPDLRLAVARGYFVCATPGSGTVALDGAVLRYDPAMSMEERARLVTVLLRDLPDGPRGRAGRGPKPTAPTRTPLEVLLVPTRTGGWRARVSGGGRTITHESGRDVTGAAGDALMAWLDVVETADGADTIARALGDDREPLAAWAAALGVELRHVPGSPGELDPGDALSLDFRRYAPAEAVRRVETLLRRADREGSRRRLSYRADVQAGAETAGGAP